MISKCVAFLVAAPVLANSCSLGDGCLPSSGASTAAEMFVSASADDDDIEPAGPPPQKHAREKRDVVLTQLEAVATGRSGKPRPKESWEQQQALEQADRARLKRKLLICHACLAGRLARDEATATVTR